MRFLVRIFSEGKSCSAMVPDLPGCVAAGDSVEEVQELIAEAIALHLDLMRRSGERIPKPTQHRFDMDELEEGELCTWVKIAKPRRKSRRQTV